MNGGPSGFNNAPLTRAIMIACALFTVFFGIQGRSNKLGLSFQKPRLWKIIVSMFAFTSTLELMFGLYLLYYFRVFERQIGSNKYSVFILFSVTVSYLLEILTLAFLKELRGRAINRNWHLMFVAFDILSLFACFAVITSGPYGLVFALFVPFFFDIPVSTRFRVLGVQLSDKTFIYLAGLQLLLSSWKRSILPGICGIIAGSLYRMNILYIRRAKLPDFIASLFSWLSWPSMDRSPSAPRTRNVVGNVPSYAGRPVETNYPSPFAGSVEPSEDSIATLVSMGFDRDSATQALVHARNDINVATNILLESQSH